EAQARVAVARAKVAQVKTGAKVEEVKAQEAVIRRCEADLAAAQEDFERGKRLLQTNAISREEHTSRRLKLQQTQAALEQGKAQLEALKAVRPEDVQAAEAEQLQAEASLAIAQEDVRNTQVRSPLSGRVLRVRARPGERISDQGILDVGNVKRMHAVAEVYEEDVGKVRIGQTARVRVPTLGVEVSGEVVSKNLVVARQDVYKNDPVADVDSRVVEVRIRLSSQDSPKVAGLSNARAEVV